jgi:transcriptional regulator with XRE-family HTH domain
MDALRRRELAAFLRSRRQRIDPAAHGFDPGRRRTPGLRREEVAAIAGVSQSWYTWLEQARDIRVSAEVLTSIGRALLLDATECEYILRLGGHAPERKQPSGPWDGDADLQALTDAFLPNPASIITPSFDYVAWNRASEWLVPGFLGCGGGGYNLARFLFCGGAARNGTTGPEDGLPSWVARLRMNAARYPHHRGIGALVEELNDGSPEFQRLWKQHDVRQARPFQALQLGHPQAGPLTFREIDLASDDHPELTLVVFLPADEATAAGLRPGVLRK